MIAVHVHKAGVMQSMLLHVAKGYVWAFGGTVHMTKVESFATKMAALYAVDASPRQRDLRKAKGFANARLFLYPRDAEFSFEYVVLLTDGRHPARDAEALCDVRERRSRLVFEDRFEALVLPAIGGAPRWTWRLTTEAFDGLATAVRLAVRKRDDDIEVRRVAHGITSMPGFRGIRQQMATLLKQLQGEWKRVRDTAACPYVGTKPKRYLRWIDIRTTPLQDAVHRMAAGGRAIPPNLVYDRTSSMTTKSYKFSIEPTLGGPGTIKSVHLDPDSYVEFTEYRDAFNAHYGVEVDDSTLASKLIILGLRVEQKSRSAQKREKRNAAQSSSNGPARRDSAVTEDGEA